MGGLHPVVAVYATFMNRAYDQVLMDVALHQAPVTFVLDRAGVTGDDGAVPQRHVGPVHLPDRAWAADRRAARRRSAARAASREAIAVDDGPTMLRYPKGALPRDIAAIDRSDVPTCCTDAAPRTC